MERYGVPYKGSKNKIGETLCGVMPTALHFYDVFAGGCAITHRMLVEGRFAHYHANDLDGMGLRLFISAVNGAYTHETRWISREDFAKLKGTDPYVTLCWSFGNNAKAYMYSREIEPWKRALHYARVFGDTEQLRAFGIEGDGSRADVIAHCDEYKRKYIRWWLSQQEHTAAELDALIERTKGDIRVQEEELRQYLLGGLESSGLTQAEVGRKLGTQMTGHYFGRSQWEFPTQEYYEQMQTFMPALDKGYNDVIGLHNLWQSLQSLQSLQRLQRLQRLQTSFCDYRELQFEKDSVVYCDPPYRGTNAYDIQGREYSFDHAAFYDWAEKQTELTIISEYDMPTDRFVCIWAKKKAKDMSASGGGHVTERLYIPKRQKDLYLLKSGRLFLEEY